MGGGDGREKEEWRGGGGVSETGRRKMAIERGKGRERKRRARDKQRNRESATDNILSRQD